MRIGVSLPDNLLSKFDTIIEERGYSSRSEGIRDAIRSYINHYEWMNDIKGPRIATITLVYDHHKRGLTSTMADIQHDYTHVIQSSTHIHIDHANCLEVIVLDGDGEDIKKLAENILSLNGVKFAKLTTVPPIDKIRISGSCSVFHPGGALLLPDILLSPGQISCLSLSFLIFPCLSENSFSDDTFFIVNAVDELLLSQLFSGQAGFLS